MTDGCDCNHTHDGGHSCSGHMFDGVKSKKANRRMADRVKQLLRANPEGLTPVQVAKKGMGMKFAPEPMAETLVRGLLEGVEGCVFENGRWQLEEGEYHSIDVTPFVVVDVETTGGRASKDRLIEIGAFTVCGGRVVDSIMAMVNPGRHIPLHISKLKIGRAHV